MFIVTRCIIICFAVLCIQSNAMNNIINKKFKSFIAHGGMALVLYVDNNAVLANTIVSPEETQS